MVVVGSRGRGTLLLIAAVGKRRVIVIMDVVAEMPLLFERDAVFQYVTNALSRRIGSVQRKE